MLYYRTAVVFYCKWLPLQAQYDNSLQVALVYGAGEVRGRSYTTPAKDIIVSGGSEKSRATRWLRVLNALVRHRSGFVAGYELRGEDREELLT